MSDKSTQLREAEQAFAELHQAIDATCKKCLTELAGRH